MAIDTKTREELMKGQILVGTFLSAFDPILRPFEDLAKHGISLSVGVIGLSGTAVSLLGRSNPMDTQSARLLLMSWVVLIGSVVFGCLQLWRTAQFRDHMREFAYVLEGDDPGDDYRKRVAKFSNLPFKPALVLEYAFLVVGLSFFVWWAAHHLLASGCATGKIGNRVNRQHG